MLLVAYGLLFLAAFGLAEKRVVCYYGTWSSYRKSEGNFEIEHLIDPTLCTHLIYSFAGLDSSTHKIRPLDPYIDLADNYGKNNYRRTVDLKNKNPSLKVLIAIGGWNEGSYSYSVMVHDAAKRRTFINSVVSFIGDHGFDGLDVDWEYPANRGGASTDKEYLIVLLRELREELDKHGWLLTIAVGMGYNTVMTGYSIAEVAAYTDFINLMTYDFYGAFNGFTDHHTRMYTNPGNTGAEIYFNLNESVHLWLDGGAPAEKLTLGLATYAQTYTVPESQIGPIGADCSGPGKLGPYTQQSGMVGYYEMCMQIQEGGWTVETDQYVLAPWAYKGNQWIAYDVPDSIIFKSQWGKELGLGGGMVWSIDTDDFQNLCGGGNFPLLKAINSIWRPDKDISPKPTTTTTTTKAPEENTSPKPPTTKTTTKAPGENTSPKPPKTTTRGTITQVPPTNSCTVGTFKADPEDCSKYYQCGPTTDGSGQWISGSCVGGLYFNVQINACDFPANVDCENTSPKPPITTTTTKEPGENTSPKQPTTTTTTKDPEEKTSPKPPKTTTRGTITQGPPTDSCTIGSFKADPEDCSKYYQCGPTIDRSGRWISRSCAGGLYFNEQINACDFPANVDCEND